MTLWSENLNKEIIQVHLSHESTRINLGAYNREEGIQLVNMLLLDVRRLFEHVKELPPETEEEI